jgi:hypothetical protein
VTSARLVSIKDGRLFVFAFFAIHFIFLSFFVFIFILHTDKRKKGRNLSVEKIFSNFDLSGTRGDARGELFQGKKFPTPLKTPINILYKLRRFTELYRVAPASSHCYRVASSSKPFY